MLVIPPFAQPLLGQFAPVFLQPTYQRLLVLIVAATLTTGRRTLSNPLRCAPGLAPGDPSSYHRAFSKRRRSSLRLARLLAGLILQRFVADGPVLLAGDDTVAEHRGAKVHGEGRHRDPVRSTHAFTAYRRGHKWVVLTILVKSPFAVRPGALPVLVALYRCTEKVPPKGKAEAKKVKDRTRAKVERRTRRKILASTSTSTSTRRHKTPSELMRQRLAVLIHWFPDRQSVFAGDGGYGTHALATFAHRHRRHVSLVSLFYPDANLYDSRGGGGGDLGADGAGRRLVWGRPPRCRGGRWDGPVVQGGRGPGPRLLGPRPGPDRDAPRFVPVQHRPDPDGPAGDRDVYGSVADRGHVSRNAGVLGPGDDPRLEAANGLACGAVPVRPVLGGGLTLRRIAAGGGPLGGRHLSRQDRGGVLRRDHRGAAAVVAGGGS